MHIHTYLATLRYVAGRMLVVDGERLLAAPNWLGREAVKEVTETVRKLARARESFMMLLGTIVHLAVVQQMLYRNNK